MYSYPSFCFLRCFGLSPAYPYSPVSPDSSSAHHHIVGDMPQHLVGDLSHLSHHFPNLPHHLIHLLSPPGGSSRAPLEQQSAVLMQPHRPTVHNPV